MWLAEMRTDTGQQKGAGFRSGIVIFEWWWCAAEKRCFNFYEKSGKAKKEGRVVVLIAIKTVTARLYSTPGLQKDFSILSGKETQRIISGFFLLTWARFQVR